MIAEMATVDVLQRIQEAEADLKSAELEFGSNDPRIAACLEACAKLLKDNKLRLLDAANMEARANVIRTDKPGADTNHQTMSSLQELGSTNDVASPQSVIVEHLKVCRFCAEQIKADAILCRFCGKRLKQRSLTLPLIGITVLIVGIVSCEALSQIGKTAISTPPASSAMDNVSNTVASLQPKGSITGAMFLNRKDGDAIILRGKQIVLCRGTSHADFEGGQIMEAMTRSTRAIRDHEFEGLMMAFKDFVRARTITVSSTGVDAKFLVPDVPAGDYCLVSQFDHSLGDKSEYACWVVPVSVKSGETSQCDLNNSNITTTCNHY
jgi:hypothetical protein